MNSFGGLKASNLISLTLLRINSLSRPSKTIDLFIKTTLLGYAIHMDKFLRGIISGLIGGVVKDVPILIPHALWNIPQITYWDYAAHIGFGGEHVNTLAAYALALPIEIAFGIGIGVIYVYLLDWIKTKHYLLAGVGFGAATWFILRAIMSIYEVEPFNKPGELTALINWVLSWLFGFIVAYVNQYLKKKDSWKR
jgi:hypothetical protein